MNTKLVLLDVDGTLLPKGKTGPWPQVIQAAKDLQKRGIKVAVATGRGLLALPKEVLGSLKPDYLICCNGAWLLDHQRQTVDTDPMTLQEMYTLVDWCEDFDYPLAFVYPDGYYAYVEYEKMYEFYNGIGGFRGIVLDGEDQDRHLDGMPFAAFCIMPPEGVQGFQEKYGYQGLRFMAYSSDKFDIGRPGVDKAVALHRLMDRLGLAPEEVAAVGDGPNDAKMLKVAGLGAAMASGSPDAIAAADVVIDDHGPEGMTNFLRGLV